MKDEAVKRDYYWVVEVCDRNGRINFRKEYREKDGSALNDYIRLRAKGAVSIQRKFREYKVV